MSLTSSVRLPPLVVSLRSFADQTVQLTAYVDMSGTDLSKWHLITLVYNEQVFNSTDDFIAAWKSGSLRRSDTPVLGDEGWADRSRKGKTTPPPPLLFNGNKWN